VKIGPADRLGRVTEKSQDRTEQSKSDEVVMFRLFGEKSLSTRICMVDNLSNIIMCAKFHDEIFKSYDFTDDQISHFLLIFAWVLQQSSAIVLSMIQHLLTFVINTYVYRQFYHL